MCKKDNIRVALSIKHKPILIAFVIISIVLSSGCIFIDGNEGISYTPGEVQIEKVTSTGAVIMITKTWSNQSMSMDDPSFQATLDWHNCSFHDSSILVLGASHFLSDIATTTGGSIQFVDVNGDRKISVGDKFYLGSETNNGAPLWSNTTYTFEFDDDSPNEWNVTFTTK